jgi:protein O-mannosyl-transferase
MTTRGGGGPSRGILLAAFAVGLAALAAYHNSLSGPFVLDDLSSIPGNPTIRQLWPLTVPLAPPRGGGLTVEGRPILNLSLAVNYALSGTGVGSYHAVNLAIHLLAGLTLLGIVGRTLRRLGPGPWADDAMPIAAAAAILWTVHPLQTEAVTYVVQRAESLMGLFYLLTIYGLIRGAEEGASRIPWLGAGILACALGMATKEVMVSAPLVAFLYDRSFLAGSFRSAWQKRRGFYLSLTTTWVVLAFLAVRAGTRGGTSGLGIGVSAWDYWLTQPAAVAHYLRLAVWPQPLVFDYGTVGAGSAAAVLPQALLLLVLAAGTVWALRWRPALGFLGFYFFAVLAPTSLVPGNRQTLAEHRMYLALAPVIVLAVAGVYRLAGRRLGLSLFLLCASALLALTVRRNRDYASELALYTDNVAHCPGNAFAQCNLGTALAAQGRVPEAIPHFEEALRLRPNYPIAQDNLGNALLRQGEVEPAIIHYRAALRLEPGFAEAQDNLGTALLRQGRPAEAMACFEEALRLDPGRAEARNNLANILVGEGRVAEAVTQYEAALRLDPAYAEAENNLGNALAREGRVPAAIQHYRRALGLRPGYAEAHYNLGNALLQANQAAPAIGEFEAALRERAAYLPARENLGNALVREGRTSEAVREYKAVLQAAPDRAVTHYNLGNALLRLNRPAEAAAQFQEALRLRPDFPEARAVLERLPP